MCWLLVDVHMSLKLKQEKVAKVVGVVNQVSCGGGINDFMPEKDRCV